MLFGEVDFLDVEKVIPIVRDKFFQLKTGLGDFSDPEELGYVEILKNVNTLERTCDIDGAKRLIEHALGRARGEGNGFFISEFLKELAILARLDKDYSLSFRYLKKSLDVARKYNEKTAEANAYGNYGLLEFILGNYESAVAYHRKSLDIHDSLGDVKRVIPNLTFIGMNFFMLGDMARAANNIDNSKVLARKYGYAEGLAMNRYYLAIIYFEKKEFLQGRSELVKAIDGLLEMSLFYELIVAYMLLNNFYRAAQENEVEKNCLCIINGIRSVIYGK